MKIQKTQYGRLGNLNPTAYKSPQSITTFTGADITAVAYIHDQLKVLGELQTISYSIHREKSAVMLLGRIDPPCFTRGPRTIAGSLIFTVFDREVLEELLNTYPDDTVDNDFSTLLLDQIPPFDVTISFMNEDGYLSSMVIYGLEIVDDGQVMSINDMIIENVKAYKARGIDLMYKKSGGVWSPARKFNPSARFESLNPMKVRNIEGDYTKFIEELNGQISDLYAQIVVLGSENTRLELTDGNQNEIDANNLEIAKLDAQIENLKREKKSMEVKLGIEERRKDLGLLGTSWHT